MESSLWQNIWMTFRKFGLDYDDFPTILENVGFLLKVLTINIYKNATIHVIFYILTSIAGFLYFYVYIISVGWMVLFRYGTAEIELGIIIFAVSWNNITCFTKFVFMKIYAKKIKDTVEKFLQCDTQVVPDTRFAKNLRGNLRVVKKRACIIWIFLMSIGIIYICIPIFTPRRLSENNIFIVYGLEPMLESPNYELGLFITTVGVGVGVYTMVAVAVYIIVVVGYNESQIQALSEELQNVWNDSENFYNHMKNGAKDKINDGNIEEPIKNEFITMRLSEIAQFHITNINLLQELDKELRPTLALEYGIITLTVIAGLLAGLENTYLSLPYAYIQIFMTCLAGQRLIDACNNFSFSVYSSQWENFNTSNRKTILLMLVMSQKTLMISAGGVAKLNFSCLMMIVRSSYSAYTALNSVVE